MTLAIDVSGVGKEYRIGANQGLRKTFREAMLDAVKAPVRRALELGGGGRDTQRIQALSDISLQVHSGEVLGVIGRNGAGKSTLLKILSRITEPSSGYVDIWGRVGSLLEVGTGFHSELTGRENIYLNGAILGMRRAEIDQKFDAIVEFSGVGKFLDTPVKRYSSGMHVRLAFSVAAHLDTDILLVDEVLAVGDASFQKKCLGLMDEVASGGRTILFVSHQLNQVRRLCSRAVCIEEGRLKYDGEPGEVIEKYQADLITDSGERDQHSHGFRHWRLTSGGHSVQGGSGPVALVLDLELADPIAHGHLGLAITDPNDDVVAGWAFENINLSGGAHRLQIDIEALPLRPAMYGLILSLFDKGNNLTGGTLVDLWHAMPKLVIDADLVSHPQDRWGGVLNVQARLKP